jgi:16S rRNA (uracil1498-N3)-methyltransferase
VAASAAAQGGRSDLPVVHPASGLRDALAGVGGELWVAVPGAGVPAGSCGSELTVAVGPEGGWSASEEALLRSRGSALGLGPWVLRTDTAVTAALAAARALVTTPR